MRSTRPTNRGPHRRPAATASCIARTNTGHDARKEPSGSFILSNPQKAIDYAYRAVHVTAETAKKIATDYYAQPIHVLVLELLLERRPSGAARGAALSRRLRRHRRQRAVGRSDRVHHRRDVEPEGADRGAGLAGEDGAGRAEGDGQVRRRRRSQGRTDRRPARVPLRRGARRAGLQRRRRCARTASRRRRRRRSTRSTAARAARASRSSRASCRAAKRSTTAPNGAHEQRVGGRDRAGAAGRQAGGLQPGRRRDALSDPRPAAAGLRLHDVRLRPRHVAGRALEQAGRREGPRPVEVPQERRQADHDLRVGGPDPAADDGRELLRGGRRRRTARTPPTSRACSWCRAWRTAAAASVPIATTP